MLRSVRGLAVGGVLAAAGQASATWSILIVDTRTGEIAVGSATCLTRLDLRELTPVLIAGRGAVTAQSAGDTSGRNRALIRDRLIQGVSPAEILAELSTYDASHQTRQYGIVDATGGTATFTGSQASAWAGGVTGQHGDLVWAVQGNILTGPNVVDGPVQAIIDTPGDLAAKLMAAMVSAREQGGDGRCSCGNDNPTGCGSPPAGDFKSAHIGYMLVARIEDLDTSRSWYPDIGTPVYFATPDIDGDGRADMAASVVNTGDIGVYFNSTPDEPNLSTAEFVGLLQTGAGAIRRLAHADINADGIDDLVFVATGPDEAGYLPGDGKGWFGAPVRIGLVGAPSRMVAGDLDGQAGDEIALTLEAAGRVVVLGQDAGALTVRTDMAMPSAPTGVAIAPMGGVLPDLVVATRTDNTVTVLRHAGDFDFSAWRTYTEAGLGPVDLAAGVIFENSPGDIAVIGGTSRRLTVLGQTAPGVFTPGTSTLLGTGRQVALGGFTPDGRRGIVTIASGNRTVEIHRERADLPGTFEAFHATRMAQTQESLMVADTNADGLDDLVGGGFGRGLTLLDNLGDGTFAEFNGFANGDYFLALNVADTLATEPDPVDTLVDQFAAWRAGLKGRIDAVRTTVETPSRVGAGAAYTLRVRARDWRGDPLDPGAMGAEAFTVAGGAQIVGVTTPEPGVAEVRVIASDTPGDDRIGIRLTAGSGPSVRLMPDAGVRVIADIADFNDDGQTNFFDLRDYLIAFGEQDPAADLNDDGAINFVDLSVFIDLFKAP
jgi:hypothetical protein